MRVSLLAGVVTVVLLVLGTGLDGSADGEEPVVGGGGGDGEVNNPVPVASVGVDADDAWQHFVAAFTASLFMIIATEIGDKTFFIGMVLAMRYSRRGVLLGSLTALFTMTVLSALAGQVLTLLPVFYTHVGVILLFVYFGIQLLKEGLEHDTAEESEFEKLEQEVKESLDTMEVKKTDSDMETGIVSTKSIQAVFMQACSLTFLAEWGDRSQIATIALAAAHPVAGVILGGCIGHAISTSIAVLSGRFLKSYVSEKSVSIFGGVTFLFFAMMTYLQGPE